MRIRYYLSLIKETFRIGFATFSEYPLDSVIWTVSMLAREVTGFIGVLLMANTLGGLGDWNLHEICMLFAMGMMIEALGQACFDSVWNIGSNVRRGRLDVMLTRPAGVFFQLLTSRVMYPAMISFFTGLVLFLCMWQKVSGGWSLMNVLFFLEYIICGCVINSSIYWIFNCFNFWLVQGNDVSVLVQTVRDFAKYPLHIFPVVIKYFMTFVLPFGFVGYYPAMYLMGEGSPYIPLALFLVAGVLFAVGNVIWAAGLRSYDSTGT